LIWQAGITVEFGVLRPASAIKKKSGSDAALFAVKIFCSLSLRSSAIRAAALAALFSALVVLFPALLSLLAGFLILLTGFLALLARLLALLARLLTLLAGLILLVHHPSSSG
jgi:hypothetical protein